MPARYDVVLSFAAEDRSIAAALAQELGRRGVSVFYDHDQRAALWGKDLYEHLTYVYRDSARYCVVFISADYVRRHWTTHERRAAQSRAFSEASEYLLPVILDDTEMPGLLNTVGYLRVPPETPVSLADAVISKLSRSPGLAWPATRGVGVTPQEPATRVSLAHLPVTGTELYGREGELGTLSEALQNGATNVVVIVAWGGVGKSALTNAWLRSLRGQSYQGNACVYAWSFYSQGTENDTSADTFVNAALTWFGDPSPSEGSAWDRGERLARLVQADRTLLVLDGLEPLQYGLGPREGRLRDDALIALLRALALSNPGLCLVTTRLTVTELQQYQESVSFLELQPLSAVAGATLLRSKGAWGEQSDLEAASDEYGGHGLALTLLGSLLRDAMRGDVRRRGELRLTEEAESQPAAMRVLAYYDRWLGRGPEASVLLLLGLFDRPANRPVLEALLATPSLALPADAPPVGTPSWRTTLARLRRFGLLVAESELDPEALDAHPLVREYFGRRLRTEHPDTWRVGNAVLFNYLQEHAASRPRTLSEMSPLYSAVVHGCRAGLQTEAFARVYWPRILRGYEYFSTYEIAAFGAELAALGAFFTRKWTELSGDLSDQQRGLLLGQVGYCLRAVGSLAEAVTPLRAATEIFIRLASWHDASVSSENLSRTLLPLGEVAAAQLEAARSIQFADRHGDPTARADKRTVLADTLHKAGKLDDSKRTFAEAESLLNGRLESFAEARFCDFLVTVRDAQLALQRTEAALSVLTSDRKGYLLRGLFSLYRGRAFGLPGPRRDQASSFRTVDSAVDLIRRSGRQDYLPEALVTRARLHIEQGNEELAERDVSEALLVSARGQMRISTIDALVERGHLQALAGSEDEAARLLEQVSQLAHQTGYLRPTPRIEALRQLLADGLID